MHYLLLLMNLLLAFVVVKNFWPAIANQDRDGMILGFLCCVIVAIVIGANIAALVKG